MTDWVDVVSKVVLGVVGLYFAHSLGRKTRQEIQAKVADKRFEAYAALWVETKTAAGIRELTGQGPLTPDERKQLATSLTAWYYDKGNGMLLSENTRKIFLEAKHNLIRKVDDLTPQSLQHAIRESSEPDLVWGSASIRQISLLRNSMRADLAIYSSPANATGGQAGLWPQDIEFLIACEVDLTRRPWRPSHRAPGETGRMPHDA